jgi:hypothetical protein
LRKRDSRRTLPVEALPEAHREHRRGALAAEPGLTLRYFASLEDVRVARQ